MITIILTLFILTVFLSLHMFRILCCASSIAPIDEEAVEIIELLCSRIWYFCRFLSQRHSLLTGNSVVETMEEYDGK